MKVAQAGLGRMPKRELKERLETMMLKLRMRRLLKTMVVRMMMDMSLD